MKKILFLTTLLLISINVFAKQPLVRNAETEEEFWKFHGSSYSDIIKFDVEDYVGVWRDSTKRNYDFKMDEDLSIELDWRKGKCKIEEQYNNILLLKCVGTFEVRKDNIEQYVKIQIFYYPDHLFNKDPSMTQRINIAMDYDKECALADYGERKEKCKNQYKSPNHHYDMYYRVEDINNYNKIYGK